MLDVPASSGYGDPITKFFRLADQVKIVGMATTDERFTPTDTPPANGEPAGPYVLVITAQGQVMRVSLGGFRTASTKVGRRFARLAEGDKVAVGDVVATIEAMKMEAAITAPKGGTVARLAIGAVQQVEGGDLLVVIGSGSSGEDASAE